MKKPIGLILKFTGIIAYIAFGLWGLIIALSIINYVAGFWGVAIAFFLFPIALVATPWYALVAWGTWYPLIIIYGGGISATILYSIGSTLVESAEKDSMPEEYFFTEE